MLLPAAEGCAEEEFFVNFVEPTTMFALLELASLDLPMTCVALNCC